MLAGTLTGMLILTVAACSPDEEDSQEVPHHSFVSRPDLKPAQVEITQGEGWTSEYQDADEYIFWTPNYGSDTPSSGAKIFDLEGEPVWVAPDDPDDSQDNYFDLRIQQYRGEPVLTYYQGPSEGGRGYGDIFILDESYQQIAQVTTTGDLEPGNADFHDTTITEDDTMLIGAYVPAQADLSEVGGPEDGWVDEAVIQEIDIASGEMLFEWSSLDHVPVSHAKNDFDDEQEELDDEAEEDEEPAQLGTEEEPFDYFHINSMTEDHDGSILVSARHTHAVYKLDRQTGELDWTLGGSGSDFDMDDDAVFAWQHDAQRAPDGTLTLLDNHANGSASDETSRGLRLSVDEEAMTASLVTEYAPPDDRSAGSMANANPLPDGNMLIGWGAEPHYSEYTKDGELIYDVCHGAGCYGDNYHGGGGSYRAYKAPWEGQPETDPDVVITDEDDEGRLAHVSWNGATQVAQWRLLSGEDESSAAAHTTVERDSFETAIPLPEDAQYTAVEALDENGEVLGVGEPEDPEENSSN
ncbi:arylsulfotransferase family protein [Garicola koreensis]|uniref:ArsR family transcriptional regulator n=1 Tax=Garicola koreensis TaxID=1262554 RepID=A0A7W5TTL0_9MICC|nr:arylsulfotransferase family protein [Garicola koreensis]MBB3667094.1 hypothetical protein [Garicola koreensis]